MSKDETDPRLEEVQDEVDAIRKRLPHEPGFEVEDPDVKPMFPADDDGPEDDTQGSDVTGTP